jgi:hypothetical protein
MMVLDHVGDQEAMVYAQLGQQPLARTTETPLQPRQGSLSCLRAQPPDLADLTVARPKVACVPLAGLPFLHSKRTAAARSLVSLSKSERFVAVTALPAVEQPRCNDPHGHALAGKNIKTRVLRELARARSSNPARAGR